MKRIEVNSVTGEIKEIEIDENGNDIVEENP
jgi:hypothetical protein